MQRNSLFLALTALTALLYRSPFLHLAGEQLPCGIVFSNLLQLLRGVVKASDTKTVVIGSVPQSITVCQIEV